MPKKILVTLFLVLVVAVVCLSWLLVQNMTLAAKEERIQKQHVDIIAFADLVIEEVLMSTHEISFDTRLALETKVRNLNDKEVLDQWQLFTEANDTQQASAEAKKLLHLLIKKIESTATKKAS